MRRVWLREDYPSDRFLLVIVLMIVFFAGLSALEIARVLLFGSWNDVIFNGMMFIVGTIVGAVWGRQSG